MATFFNRLFGNNSNSNGVPAKSKTKRNRGRTLRIEELESREMLSVTPWSLAGDVFDQHLLIQNETIIVDNAIPQTTIAPIAAAPVASISPVMQGQTLLIEGTNGADWIEIQETSTQIIVYSFNSTGTTQLNQWEFAKNTISTIAFNGYGGNDTFKNSYNGVTCSIACRLDGGTGNNTLFGGNGNDIIDGGNGNHLVFCGLGTNTLYNAGTGSSVFFTIETATINWASGSKLGDDDAILLFSSKDRSNNSTKQFEGISYTTRAWTNSEIVSVINATIDIYHDIGTYAYFRDPYASDGTTYLTIFDSNSAIWMAGMNSYWVDGDGISIVFNGSVSKSTLVHEFAHNWDGNRGTGANPYWDEFRAISWNSATVKKDGAVNGDFASNYGMTNWMEDWTTTCQAIIGGTKPSSGYGTLEKWQQKVDIVERFIDWLGGNSEYPITLPTITTQPQSTTYTQNQSAAALTVVATANGELAYQWYKDGVAISGATSASYSPSTATVGVAEYYCIVTNCLDGLCEAAQSNAATITVTESITDSGDTLATAMNVTLTDGTFNTTQALGDVPHIYKFTVSAGDVGKALMFCTSLPPGGTDVDTYIRLFNSAGLQLAYDDDGGNGYYSRLLWTPTVAGTYYLGVSSFDNRNYNPNVTNSGTGGEIGDYMLTITDYIGPSLEVGNTLDLSGGKTLDNTALDWNAVLSNNRYIIVNFTASWCGYCSQQLDELLAIYPTYKSQGLEIISAYTLDTLFSSKAKVAEKSVPWINITDNFLDISYTDYYGFSGVPRVVIVDCASGKIISKRDGYASGWIDWYLPTLDWTPVSRPAAPTNVVATQMPGEAKVSLSWTDSGNADSYEVYQCLGNSGTCIKVANSNITFDGMSATITDPVNLVNGASVYYTVVAVKNGIISEQSEVSNTVTITSLPPTASVNFRSTEQSTNSVTLSWNLQTGLIGYTLQYSVSGTNDWKTWTAPEVTATDATITGLALNTAYEFRLTATNTVGSHTSETTATTKNTPAAPPVKPQVKVETKQATINSVVLTLSSKGIVSNAVYVITCTSHPYISVPPATGTPIVIEGLEPGTTYKFTVVAQNADGRSNDAIGKSTAVKVTAKTPKYTAVKAKTDKTGTTIDTVTLTWATQGRPEGEKYAVKVLEAKTKAEVVIPSANLVFGTGADKKGKELTTLTITGLTAGTKYKVEVQAYVGTSLESATFKANKVAKVTISTAKYPAPKIDMLKGMATIPAFINGLSGINYQHYEIYYIDASKQGVCIGTVSLPAPPNAKDKIELNFGVLTPNANFVAFETWLQGLGKKSVKFVVKAVTKDASGNVVNWSAGGSFSMKAEDILL